MSVKFGLVTVDSVCEKTRMARGGPRPLAKKKKTKGEGMEKGTFLK